MDDLAAPPARGGSADREEAGADYLKGQRAKTELAGVDRELKRLKRQVTVLEERKAKLMADLGK